MKKNTDKVSGFGPAQSEFKLIIAYQLNDI